MKDLSTMTFDPIALGATLYVPATHDAIEPILSGTRHPDLRSVVLCLEDAIRPDEDPFALGRMQALLARLGDRPGGPALFVRPRNAAMLERIAGFAGIDAVTGFVLPKATADSMADYLAALAASPHHALLMPTLETREAFDGHEMRRLRDLLMAVQDRVLALRIGGNDLMQTLGARRSGCRTIYEGPLGPTIATLVATFAPWGFALTAPVFERFDDPALLREEVERDIEHGLIAKTAIHPAQIAVIHAAYAVPQRDLVEARAILDRQARAVFATAGGMTEPATHRGWAERIVRRADHFGIVPAPDAARSA